ncbi:MAG: hypothetical protein NC340_04925 [Ruminococcus flavefaciens]|nr:hypothetical protein [Ruminococcus flavefaciens]MCM1228992.1 hypothetical protein [Ruminococcus flavefaciens]
MENFIVTIIELFVFLILFAVAVCAVVGIAVNRKKKKSITKTVTVLVSSMALFAVSAFFASSHKTYYKYNDFTISRSNIAEIIEKYGEFDIGNYHKGSSGRAGYYIYTDNGPVMPDHLPHYYYIEYDETGAVTKIFDGLAPGG